MIFKRSAIFSRSSGASNPSSSSNSVKAKGKSYTPKSVFEVLTAEQLLAAAPYQKLLKKITKLVDVSDEHYQALYAALIDQFVEYAQVLPVTVGGDLCSLLNRGLARAYFAVDHYKKINPDHNSHLHNYIFFSAFLLRDIGRIACGRFINICTETGEYIATWRPFESAMLYQGECYRIRDKAVEEPELHKRLTPVLAQKLVPDIGFAWIAEREDTLNLWFALMDDLPDELSHYEKIYEVAQTYAIEYFSGPEFLLPLEVKEARAMIHGENFFEWLKQQLGSGKITVNEDDSLVNEVDNGLLLDVDKLAEKYEKYDGNSANKSLKEFERVGLTYVVEGSTRETYRKYSKREFHSAPKKGGFVSSFKSNYNKKFEGNKGQKAYTLLKGLVLKDKKLVAYEAKGKSSTLAASKSAGLPELSSSKVKGAGPNLAPLKTK